jgi:Flp pilus assembly protein TadB
MGFYDYLASRNPSLKTALRVGRIIDTPEEFLRKAVRSAMVFSAAITFTFTVLIGLSPMTLLVFMVAWFAFYSLFKNRPLLSIKKRRQKIDKDLLFAGQYMLVKLESGLPLFNTLIHASKEYNETGFFFKEIVQDINTGTPIEQALSKARDYCPSANMKRILSEIVTSLKTGADVTDTLKNSIKEISRSLLLEVRAYGKKLNSLMMFYMIIGTVLPSIGVSLLIIFFSFAGILMDNSLLIVTGFLLALMQLFFIAIVNSSRPTVNV